MRLAEIAVSGFRGFRAETRLLLAPGFNVIDGRNGVGKSTLFDAVEFALTGQLTKYGDSKAAGETVKDYLWWKGDGPSPSARFVEVTFVDDNGPLTIRRTPIDDPNPQTLAAVQAAMIHADAAPPFPLQQLCASSIIRDELIATLSLDLSEADRYALLRQAIGAGDAEAWTERGQLLVRAAKHRSDEAKSEVTAATAGVAEAQRQLDEARAALTSDAAVAAATSRLLELVGGPLDAPDQLAASGREFIVRLERELREGQTLLARWDEIAAIAGRLDGAESEIERQAEAVTRARAEREALPAEETAAGALADLVRNLHDLHQVGDGMGLLEGGCPLCAAPHDEASFVEGRDRARKIMEQLDAAAAKAARQREAIGAADTAIAASQDFLNRLTADVAEWRKQVEWRRRTLEMLNARSDETREDLSLIVDARHRDLDAARHAVRILGTVAQNEQLERAAGALNVANLRLQRAQERAAKSRQAEGTAAALHDAARRAAGETLDLRLQRVLPLMAELYGRLRPHPFWQDIEYSVRGDVRRFLSLKVGDGLNPQFLFSSGQRRATGLAFLLSIYLSLTWSRWRTILLDDPVQHVDDFRTVNLAEVLAQLVSSGRQVIVAVEDAALADLLCRRMPIAAQGTASRLTLGLDADGTSALIDRRELIPLKRAVL
jgi:DNA repair exonuclease SbcCD ATPase subunit